MRLLPLRVVLLASSACAHVEAAASAESVPLRIVPVGAAGSSEPVFAHGHAFVDSDRGGLIEALTRDAMRTQSQGLAGAPIRTLANSLQDTASSP